MCLAVGKDEMGWEKRAVVLRMVDMLLRRQCVGRCKVEVGWI